MLRGLVFTTAVLLLTTHVYGKTQFLNCAWATQTVTCELSTPETREALESKFTQALSFLKTNGCSVTELNTEGQVDDTTGELVGEIRLAIGYSCSSSIPQRGLQIYRIDCFGGTFKFHASGSDFQGGQWHHWETNPSSAFPDTVERIETANAPQKNVVKSLCD